MQTTALYPNRQADKAWVEAEYGWEEEGDHTTPFLLPDGTTFAVGYRRIVYGDHGPYVEFEAGDIILPLHNKFPDPQKEGIYYIWQYPAGHRDVKVYYQLKDVKNVPNAPRRDDGKRSSFNRSEGYADYKPGFYYIAPGAFRKG